MLSQLKQNKTSYFKKGRDSFNYDTASIHYMQLPLFKKKKTKDEKEKSLEVFLFNRVYTKFSVAFVVVAICFSH